MEYILVRDGCRCSIPGCQTPTVFSKNDMPTLDHIVPTSKGGPDNSLNWAVAHRSCNNHKGDRLVLPDGTLEPKPFKEPKKKTDRKKPCEKCWEGRNLGPNDVCSVCGMTAMPQPFPRYRQRTPKECDHNEYFCWSCLLGFSDRKEVAVDIGLVMDIEDEINVR